MRYYKAQCEVLKCEKAKVYIIDYSSGRAAVLERIVVGIFGRENGRDSIWGVRFNKPYNADNVIVGGAYYSSLFLNKKDAEIKAAGINSSLEL